MRGLTAKMVVESVTQTKSGANYAQSFRARPVFGDSEENKAWSRWTPSGVLELMITNPAGQFFEPGQTLMVSIECEDEE